MGAARRRALRQRCACAVHLWQRCVCDSPVSRFGCSLDARRLCPIAGARATGGRIPYWRKWVHCPLRGRGSLWQRRMPSRRTSPRPATQAAKGTDAFRCACMLSAWVQSYGWPFGLTPKWRRLVEPYKQAAWSVLARGAAKLRCGRWRCTRSPQGTPEGIAMDPPDAPGLPLAVELPLQKD